MTLPTRRKVSWLDPILLWATCTRRAFDLLWKPSFAFSHGRQRCAPELGKVAVSNRLPSCFEETLDKSELACLKHVLRARPRPLNFCPRSAANSFEGLLPWPLGQIFPPVGDDVRATHRQTKLPGEIPFPDTTTRYCRFNHPKTFALPNADQFVLWKVASFNQNVQVIRERFGGKKTESLLGDQFRLRARRIPRPFGVQKSFHPDSSRKSGKKTPNWWSAFGSHGLEPWGWPPVHLTSFSFAKLAGEGFRSFIFTVQRLSSGSS